MSRDDRKATYLEVHELEQELLEARKEIEKYDRAATLQARKEEELTMMKNYTDRVDQRDQERAKIIGETEDELETIARLRTARDAELQDRTSRSESYLHAEKVTEQIRDKRLKARVARAELERNALLKEETDEKATVDSQPDKHADIWAQCDKGKAAQDLLEDTYSKWLTMQDPIEQIVHLIPVQIFATNLKEWNKRNHSQFAKLARTYVEARPQTTDMLINATIQDGENARELIVCAKQTIFGSEDVHDIAVYGLMIYIWATHKESGKKQMVREAIDQYLRATDSQVTDVLKASKEGKQFEFPAACMSKQGKDNGDLRGMKRLNYQESPTSFTQAWLDLWSIIVNRMAIGEEMNREEAMTTSQYRTMKAKIRAIENKMDE